MMKTTRIALAGLALLAVMGQPATSAQYWQTTQITSGHTWFTGSVKVSADKIYWTDRRNGDADVYVWDKTGGERPLIQGSDSVAVWAACEQNLVVSKYVNSQYDLYLWDPAGGMQTISTAPGNQQNADIYGETVVYEDSSTGVSQVWIWDPANGARPISPCNAAQQYPRIYGDSVVWQDGRNGRWDVYMWNPRDGEQRLSTYIYGMDHPDIYEDRVVMSVHWEYQMPDPYGIWEYRIGQGLVGPLVEQEEAYFTRMWGDTLVWQISPPGSPVNGIEVYHPSTGVVGLGRNVGTADLYDNKVVWVDNNYNIYMAELVPEPSSFLALGGGCVGLLGLLRRRRRSAR